MYRRYGAIPTGVCVGASNSSGPDCAERLGPAPRHIMKAEEHRFGRLGAKCSDPVLVRRAGGISNMSKGGHVDRNGRLLVAGEARFGADEMGDDIVDRPTRERRRRRPFRDIESTEKVLDRCPLLEQGADDGLAPRAVGLIAHTGTFLSVACFRPVRLRAEPAPLVSGRAGRKSAPQQTQSIDRPLAGLGTRSWRADQGT